MNEIKKIKGTIDRIKIHSQELKNEISTLKENSISTSYYLGNLKRLSLQALDLFNAMERQINFLNNQRTLAVINSKPLNRTRKREFHGISLE
jgi:hypothetical protein